MLAHSDQSLLVYEKQGEVVGMISIHFAPQLALAGDFATISYLAVAEHVRSEGIGAKLEAYCTQLAVARNCDRVYAASSHLPSIRKINQLSQAFNWLKLSQE